MGNQLRLQPDLCGPVHLGNTSHGPGFDRKLAPVRVLVGTSGYSYAPWKGSFYPQKLPAAKMLGFYATKLPTVEINNTFYRMPAAEMLQRWAAETPDSFSFVLKSPKRITHERRLLDAGDTVKRSTRRRRRWDRSWGRRCSSCRPT